MNRIVLLLALLITAGCEEQRSTGPIGTQTTSAVDSLRSSLTNYSKTGEGDSGVTVLPDQIKNLKSDNVDESVITKLEAQYAGLDKQGLKKTATDMLDTLNKAIPPKK